jgi:hypothetical protein
MYIIGNGFLLFDFKLRFVFRLWLMIFSDLGYIGIDILFIELIAGFDKPATVLILLIEKGSLGIVFL